MSETEGVICLAQGNNTLLTTGVNESFAPDAQRWIAVVRLITVLLGPKNKRTEVLASTLRQARKARSSNDMPILPDGYLQR